MRLLSRYSGDFMNFINSNKSRWTDGIIVHFMVFALAFFCLMGVVVKTSEAQSDGAKQKQAGQKSEKNEKSGEALKVSGILWQEPNDIERRDLFYGNGGQAGAPNTASKFTFLEDKGSPKD